MAITDSKMTLRVGFYAAVALMVLTLAGCTSSESKSHGSHSGKAPEGVEDVASTVNPDGGGMEIPLDGSSLEAFDASLARVKSLSSPEDYKTLEAAIDYLLVYDLAARRDKAKLAARLNGLNGYEVVAKVNWRKPAPGKSKAEKGATDVKIIDT
jgi:hypothetical protein